MGEIFDLFFRNDNYYKVVNKKQSSENKIYKPAKICWTIFSLQLQR